MEDIQGNEISTPAIGEAFKDLNGGMWTIVAILQPDVVVARYETLPSEPNWAGTEGYQVFNVLYDLTLEGVAGEILAPLAFGPKK